jgi:hypothetical protein
MLLLSGAQPWLFGIVVFVIIVIIFKIMKAYAIRYQKKEKKLQEEHQLKHFELVQALLKGDVHSRKESKQEALAVYPQWVAMYTEIGKNATKKDHESLGKLKAKNSYFDYWPGAFVYKQPSAIDDKNATVLKDCFTNIFPSTHDMDDWALGTRLTEIFVLKGLDRGFPQASVVYIKNHFVNHDMVRGIIHFDLYIPKLKPDSLKEIIEELKREAVKENSGIVV